MQVYVTTALISATGDTPVIATYDDTVTVAPGTYANGTRFWFVDSKHITVGAIGMALAVSWRDDLVDVINDEANYRITAVFPPYRQQNAAIITQTYMMEYGNDKSQWPIDAQNQQAEIDRGWTYVNNVRKASGTLYNTGPLNPCDDSLWPANIPAITLTPL
jgi:hypothetical protein